MGSEYEVCSYVRIGEDGEDGIYEYQQVYGGDSLMDALAAMREEKQKGVWCVKLEWR